MSVQKNPLAEKKVIYFGVAGLALLAVIVVLSISLFNRPADKKTEAAKNDTTPTLINNTDPANTPSNVDTSQALPIENKTLTPEEVKKQILENPNLTEEDKKVEVGRVDLQQFLASPFNPEEVKEENNFPILTLKENELNIKISYSSIGDQIMDKATLFVKLGDGIKVIPGSMKDSCDGKDISVADSVYSGSDNTIKYGPCSTDKAVGKLDIGKSGVLSFKIQGTDSIKTKASKIYSFIQNDGGNPGKIDYANIKAS